MKRLTLNDCAEIVGATPAEIAQETGLKLPMVRRVLERKQTLTPGQALKMLNFFAAKGLSVSIDFIDFALPGQRLNA